MKFRLSLVIGVAITFLLTVMLVYAILTPDLPHRSNNNKFGNYGTDQTEDNNSNNNNNNCRDSCSGGCSRCKSDCCRYETVNRCSSCYDDARNFKSCKCKKQGCTFNTGDYSSAPCYNCDSCSCNPKTNSLCNNCETADCLCNSSEIEDNSTPEKRQNEATSEVTTGVNTTDLRVQNCSCKCSSEVGSCPPGNNCSLSTIIMSNCSCNCTRPGSTGTKLQNSSRTEEDPNNEGTFNEMETDQNITSGQFNETDSNKYTNYNSSQLQLTNDSTMLGQNTTRPTVNLLKNKTTALEINGTAMTTPLTSTITTIAATEINTATEKLSLFDLLLSTLPAPTPSTATATSTTTSTISTKETTLATERTEARAITTMTTTTASLNPKTTPPTANIFATTMTATTTSQTTITTTTISTTQTPFQYLQTIMIPTTKTNEPQTDTTLAEPTTPTTIQVAPLQTTKVVLPTTTKTKEMENFTVYTTTTATTTQAAITIVTATKTAEGTATSTNSNRPRRLRRKRQKSTTTSAATTITTTSTITTETTTTTITTETTTITTSTATTMASTTPTTAATITIFGKIEEAFKPESGSEEQSTTQTTLNSQDST